MSASLSRLQSFYGDLKAPLLLHAMIRREFKGAIALLLHPGTDATELLAIAADIDTALPLLCMDGVTPPAIFSTIVLIDGAPHDTIEDMALLAVISDEIRAPGTARIALDAEGMFRIYPMTPHTSQEKPADQATDWSV